MNPALLSSSSEHWCTAPDIIELCEQAAGKAMDFDPCSNDLSLVGAPDACVWPERDGLKARWWGHILMNPPYGKKIKPFIVRAAEFGGRGATIYGIVPARTDTAWGQLAMQSARALLLWRGRMVFWALQRLEDAREAKGWAGRGPGNLPDPWRMVGDDHILGPQIGRETGEALPAPFPTMVPFWGPQSDLEGFVDTFRHKGVLMVKSGRKREILPELDASAG